MPPPQSKTYHSKIFLSTFRWIVGYYERKFVLYEEKIYYLGVYTRRTQIAAIAARRAKID